MERRHTFRTVLPYSQSSIIYCSKLIQCSHYTEEWVVNKNLNLQPWT